MFDQVRDYAVNKFKRLKAESKDAIRYLQELSTNSINVDQQDISEYHNQVYVQQPSHLADQVELKKQMVHQGVSLSNDIQKQSRQQLKEINKVKQKIQGTIDVLQKHIQISGQLGQGQVPVQAVQVAAKAQELLHDIKKDVKNLQDDAKTHQAGIMLLAQTVKQNNEGSVPMDQQEKNILQTQKKEQDQIDNQVDSQKDDLLDLRTTQLGEKNWYTNNISTQIFKNQNYANKNKRSWQDTLGLLS